MRNSELKSVNFEKASLSYDQIRRFIDELSKLKELSFDCRSENLFDDLARIMKETNDLQRIAF